MSVNLPQAVEAWAASPLVEALGWALVHSLWQGAAVAIPLALLLLCLRRSAAHVRYLVACTGLLFMVMCPTLTLAYLLTTGPTAPSDSPSTLRPLPPPSTVADGTNFIPPPAVANSEGTKETPATAANGLAASTQPGESTSREWVAWASLRPHLVWFVVLWFLGVAGLTIRLGAGWVWLQCNGRRWARPITGNWQEVLNLLANRMGVHRATRLLQSTWVEVPTLMGWLRPVVLLPASSLLGLTPRQMEAILAHELAHVRRHDYLVNLIQTAVETLLFYHPATWWLSRVIRHEREACCDAIAAQVTGDRLEYARALAAMEDLRCRQPQLVIAATGGILLDRVRRILGFPAARTSRSAWWMMAMIVLGLAAAIGSQDSATVFAGTGNPTDDWGPEAGGLRCRLVATPTDANDESPDASRVTDKFARGDDVAFVVEIKNVSEQPVTLMGVRYGDSYPTAAGKLATASFAPHLFDFEFTDKAGKPIPGPQRAFVASMLQLSGASVHEVAPGKSFTVLLRPARFGPPMDYRLPPGEYRTRVRYHGPSVEELAGIRKHWPDKPQGKAWTGSVVSNPVAFTIASDPQAPMPPTLAWGETRGGLRAAVEFRHQTGDPPGTIPLNTKVDVILHVQNVSDKNVSLVSETWRQDDQVFVRNDAGQERAVSGVLYSGMPIMVRWTLRPGETAELRASNLAVAADEDALKKFEHPVGKTLVARPGTYTFHYVVRIGSIQTQDDKGNVVSPAKDDWQGELTTGAATLKVRARTPADDQRERAGLFNGRIQFVAMNGQPITSGVFRALGPLAQGVPPLAAIQGETSAVPDCSADRPQTIYVRAPGFEEAYFYDVTFRPDEVKKLELRPAAPTRLRLIRGGDGRPIAGAKVRFFNKSSDRASAGPFPVDGIAGPVWGTSGPDGRMTLESLQKVDPHYANLGDAVYYFYVEAAELPGTLIGPVKAGADVGDVTMGPFLEVRGEVRGTPLELERFTAEWDQPFELRTTNKDAAWQYAVSSPLETKREGDKLTFHLKDLRPGKLRIISNFAPHPQSVHHTYGRRDAKESDVLVELTLTESIPNLIITPRGRQAP